MVAPAPEQPPTVGLLGSSDEELLGDALFRRVAEAELLRRLREGEVRTLTWGSEGWQERAGTLDLVVVGGELGRDSESERWFRDPVSPDGGPAMAWSSIGFAEDTSSITFAPAAAAVVTARDPVAKRRLEAAEIAASIVPDPAFLAPRLFPEETRDRRLRQLRMVGSIPDGPYVVVQGTESLLGRLPSVADQVGRMLEDRPEVAVVLLSTSEDERFAKAAARELSPARAHVLPAGSPVEDVIAVLASAEGVLVSSPAAFAVGASFGVPGVLMHLEPSLTRDGLGELIGEPDLVVQDPELLAKAFELAGTRRAVEDRVALFVARIDEHFDELSELTLERAAARGWAPPSPPDPVTRATELERELSLLREAHRDRGRRLIEERLLYADLVSFQKIRIERLEGELHDLRNLKTIRYTSAIRRAYGRVRGWFRR